MNTKGEKLPGGLLAYMEKGYVINGRYEVQRRLGRGGFAFVFVGLDRQIEREVAIKVMNTAAVIDDEELRQEFVKRFQREAKLAARVDHPNVLNIFDYGVIEKEDEPFMVMELLQGHDLEVHLQQHGPMMPERAIPLLLDVLVALGMAHEQGIIHKDLKPGNLFLKRPDTRFEALCVLDFGIAHIEQEMQSRLTQAGKMVGTPAYLAPEYAMDSVVSPALDVYQMGLLLVELLTGKQVVDEPNPTAAVFQHMRGDLEIPVALLQSPLGPILARALHRDPEQRFQNGLEFADALAEVPVGSVLRLEPDCPKEILSEYLEDFSLEEDSQSQRSKETSDMTRSYADLHLAKTEVEDVSFANTMAMHGAKFEEEALDDTLPGDSDESQKAPDPFQRTSTILYATADVSPTVKMSQRTSRRLGLLEDENVEAHAAVGDGADGQDRPPAKQTEPMAEKKLDDSSPRVARPNQATFVDNRKAIDNQGTTSPVQSWYVRIGVAAVVAAAVGFAIWTYVDFDDGEDTGEVIDREQIAGAFVEPDELTPQTEAETRWRTPAGEPIEFDADGDEPTQEAVGEDIHEEPALVELLIETDPPSAAVFMEDARLGETPLLVGFEDEEADPRQLILRLDGHREKSIEVRPDDAPRRTWTLEKFRAQRSIPDEDSPEQPPSTRDGETARDDASEAESDDVAEEEENGDDDRGVLLPDF